METVLIGIRLGRLRGQLSSTLSSNGSGYTSRRFLKLFIMSLSMLVIYLPLTLFFFYLNLPLPMEPYSWSRVHDPVSWDPIIYFVTSDYPKVQYYGWSPVTFGCFIILYYGLNDEAVEMYRHFLCVCGLGKIWPSLKEPRQPRRRGKSWSSHLDLVGKAAQWFDGRKASQASSNA
jgi:pheromone a factor receptor